MTAIEFLSLPVVSIAALAPNLSTYQLEGVASRISWGNMSYQLGAIVPNLSIPQLAVLLPALSCPMLAEAMVLLPARTLNTLLTDTSLSVGPGLCRKCPDTMKDALPGLDAPTQAYLKPFLGMGESGDKCDKVRAMSDDQITKEFPSKSMGDLTNLIGCLSEPQLKKVLLLLSDPQIKAVMPLLATGAVVEAVPPCSDAQLGAAIPAMDATQLKAFTTQYSARFAGYAAAAPGLSESQVRAVLPSVPDFTAAAMFPRMSSANMLVAAPLLSAAAAKMGVAAVGEADQAAVVPLLAAPQLDTVLPVLTPPVLSTVRGAVAPKLPLVAKSTIDKLTDPQLVALGLLAGVAPAPAVARAGTGWAPGGLPKDKAAPGEFKQVGFWAAMASSPGSSPPSAARVARCGRASSGARPDCECALLGGVRSADRLAGNPAFLQGLQPRSAPALAQNSKHSVGGVVAVECEVDSAWGVGRAASVGARLRLRLRLRSSSVASKGGTKYQIGQGILLVLDV
eukprot:CAMPEP_0182909768 /NCGR_PEP_ID=MMETSP0034_2-20130328/35935_1 /TAXON_ID=156128 /ORGANISM="Nephroselmis pyriformis, Strain CCMP717" /LENGTH=508 /DNA_ID=CAMNT_0025046043 /DNA_START=26 /DNA_END=1548 /DNA_ORIENTATION=-